jgi:predicted DNA-binding protein with PD1-like motif
VRRVEQPGPAPAERVVAVEARGRPVAFALPAGASLLDAVRDAFAAEGCASGVLTLESGAFGPFAYVMPALSPTPRHAAFYSETHRPPDPGELVTGALTFGRRDGRPFFHCHAFWRRDGRIEGGHLLPEETTIAASMRATGIGLLDACFEATPDPETNFPLFAPVAGSGRASSGVPVVALRLRPNQDLATAVEAICAERRLPRARLHGGVGSIIGARFEDGRVVEPFATEMAVRSGVIEGGPRGTPEATLDVALVDLTGAVSHGRLRRGDNPILMTLEAVLAPG